MPKRARTTSRSLGLIRAFLAWQAAIGFGTAFALLALPPQYTTGPAMTTVYGMAPRPVWGAIFATLATACAATSHWPTHWRYVVIALITVHTAWALGLTLPLFVVNRQTNLITPIAWGSVAGSALIIANHATDERRP